MENEFSIGRIKRERDGNHCNDAVDKGKGAVKSDTIRIRYLVTRSRFSHVLDLNCAVVDIKQSENIYPFDIIAF